MNCSTVLLWNRNSIFDVDVYVSEFIQNALIYIYKAANYKTHSFFEFLRYTVGFDFRTTLFLMK